MVLYGNCSFERGGSAEGYGQAGWMDQSQLYDVQQGQVLAPTLGSQQTPATLQPEGRVAGNCPVEKDVGMLVDNG